jgi:FKBP-type peptidyl-prolyl cis-trans isomerase
MRGNPEDGPPTLPTGVETTRTDTGLEFLEVQSGEGEEARKGRTVRIHYNGWLTDGTLFETSIEGGEPLEIVLGEGQVIRALDEGLEGMRVGGVRRIIAPSDLAYGPSGNGEAVPPYATLIFDVELLDLA